MRPHCTTGAGGAVFQVRHRLADARQMSGAREAFVSLTPSLTLPLPLSLSQPSQVFVRLIYGACIQIGSGIVFGFLERVACESPWLTSTTKPQLSPKLTVSITQRRNEVFEMRSKDSRDLFC